MSGKKILISEQQWGCIVPAILMIVLIIAVVTGCYPTGAKAAEVEPSPSPLPADVEHVTHISVLGVAGIALFIGGVLFLAIRSMNKNTY